MTRKKRDLNTFTHRAAWPESELFPHAIITEKLGDLAPRVIEQIRPAWQDYRSREKLRAEMGTRAEQIAAARELADLCMQTGKALQAIAVDHLEADAWLYASREGFDLDDAKQDTGRQLTRIAAYYVAAANKGTAPIVTKAPKLARDDFARVIVAAVEPHGLIKSDIERILHDVLTAAGAEVPGDLASYRRDLKRSRKTTKQTG